MATSYTPILKLALPANGELSGTWGTVVNENITSMIEEAVTGRASITSWTANAHTLTQANGTTSESRCLMLDLNGTLTATGTLNAPAGFNKLYIVRNNTSGGFAVNVGMPTGASVSVPNGKTMMVYSDGTNVKEVVTNVSSLSIGGFSLSLANSFTTAGNNALTLTTIGPTNVTLPTTGVLATQAGVETLTNKTVNLASNTLTGTTAQFNAALFDGDFTTQTTATGSVAIPSGTTAQRDGVPTAGYFRYNSTLGAFEGYTATGWGSVGGGGITYVRKTANYTASKNEGIIADTTGGTFTVTLPATPGIGDTVVIADGGNWSTTNLTVGRNGSTIEGDAEDMVLNIGGVAVQFTYDGTTWQVYTQAGITGSSITTFEFVATAGQTTFSGNDANSVPLAYTPGAVIVSLNGVQLRPGDNYTATTGNSIVLGVPAAAGDELQVVAFTAFSVANTYTKAEVDSKVVAGGTYTGAINLPVGGLNVGSGQLKVDSAGRVTMGGQPAFFAYRTGSYMSPTGDGVFNTTRFNRGGHYSTSTGRFTAPVDGVYFFTAIGLPLSTVNYPFMYLFKNGGTYSAATYVINPDQSVSISAAIELVVGDYVTVYYIDGSEASYSHFSGFLVG